MSNGDDDAEGAPQSADKPEPTPPEPDEREDDDLPPGAADPDDWQDEWDRARWAP
ncbi:hypothetical protein [Nocardia crassostreae]|uniref:hypothetical protein n=1 Tax=Nocardia crassostreae TaxID=53428 RepID=UPI000AD35DEE|nr:hypothetical protein [Nocardia crassostreae]